MSGHAGFSTRRTSESSSQGSLSRHSIITVVALGEATRFWTLGAQPAGAGLTLGANPVRFKHPSYFADTASSAWVAGSTNGVDNVVGGFAYALTVDLSGFNPDSAVVGGIFGTDNDGSIALNGNAPVATTAFAGFGAPTALTFTDGFVGGLNTMTVAFNNGGGPTAFHVQFSSATASPVPPETAERKYRTAAMNQGENPGSPHRLL